MKKDDFVIEVNKYYSSAYPVPTMVRKRNWPPSCTQPDEALSIQEILLRVSQGLTTGIGASTSDDDYDDDNNEDWDDPTLEPGFDKLDAAMIANSDETEAIQGKIKEAHQRQRKQKKDEEFKKKVDEEIERRKKEEPQQ